MEDGAELPRYPCSHLHPAPCLPATFTRDQPSASFLTPLERFSGLLRRGESEVLEVEK